MGFSSNGDRREPAFWTMVLLCWLVADLQLVLRDWTMVASTLGDTDDALRLVQMRSFLAGQGWFDLHEARLGPPLGYDSHWSRLIDLGLAGLFLFFHLFLDTARSEFMMRIVWPLLWLLPTIVATAAIAWRIGGREVALLLLLLAMVGMPALQQFRPGRIDHHNVQIALAMAALAAAAWADRTRVAAACGAIIGTALAIGLEALPLLVVAGAAPALRYCVDRERAPQLRAYGLALAVSTLVAFLLDVGPAHWGRTACDALAINWMEPVVFAGVAMVVLGGVLPGRSAFARCLAVGAAVAATAAIFVALEPRCLAGPYAMMDASVRTTWLSAVQEMQPLSTILRQNPSLGAVVIAFPAAALVAMAVLARRPEMRRNDAFLIAAAGSLVAIALTIMAAKTFHYAIWICMPLVAALAPRVYGALRLQTMGARVFTAIMLTPSALSSGAAVAVEAAGAKLPPVRERTQLGCFDSKHYSTLAQLPTGVFAGDIDFGPFILALTPHASLGAPYHRLSKSIVAVNQLFALPADAARRVIDAHGVTYLMTCGTEVPYEPVFGQGEPGLGKRIYDGDLPDWLEKLPKAAGQVFTVYRVRNQAS